MSCQRNWLMGLWIIQLFHGLRIARDLLELRGIAARNDRQPLAIGREVNLAEIVMQHCLCEARTPVRVAVLIAVRGMLRRLAAKFPLRNLPSPVQNQTLALQRG